MILRGPDPETDGASAWRAADVFRICRERFGVEYTEAGMLGLMKGLDEIAPRQTGHSAGFDMALMNSRCERYPSRP